MFKSHIWKTFFMVLLVPVLVLVLSGCTSDDETNQESRDTVGTQSDRDGGTQAAGLFADYSPELVSQAAADEDVVLFFHAQWCSVCKRIESDIEANLSDIPANVRILQVDFDDETELKREYGVTQQYTMVQVNNQGDKVDSWNSSFSLNDILETIV